MEYWNSLITEKSWRTLQELAESRLNFTLIGGWAAYLWTKTQKSKDVDIVLDTVNELEALKKRENLGKNESLRKYGIKHGEIDIDVYVPYYSKLAIPPEKIPEHSTKLEGFKVATPEALCILKQGAEEQRENTPKGLKDRIDIISLLLNTPFDYKKHKQLAEKYEHKNYPQRLQKTVTSFTEGRYINQNPHQLKQNKKKILEKLKQT